MSQVIDILTLSSYIVVGGCIIYNLYHVNQNLMELQDIIRSVFQK